MMMLSMVFVMCSMAQESGDRIAEVLNHESVLRSPENGATDVKDGSVEFDHVSFRYSGKNKNLLTDVILRFRPVPPSRYHRRYRLRKDNIDPAGPTSLRCDGGRGEGRGRDVRGTIFRPSRDAVAVVLQKNVLFSGTIKENLRWGNKNATDEELITRAD